MPYFGNYRNIEPPPLGQDEMPSDTPAKAHTPCGEYLPWDEASFHVLECDLCDEQQRKLRFIAPWDNEARRVMGMRGPQKVQQKQYQDRGE
jgi:hypothetical protein